MKTMIEAMLIEIAIALYQMAIALMVGVAAVAAGYLILCNLLPAALRQIERWIVEAENDGR